jgi:hypothetical protein
LLAQGANPRVVFQVALVLDQRVNGDWLDVPERFKDITDGLKLIS